MHADISSSALALTCSVFCTAKNVILAGVRSVTLLDNNLVEPRDLSAQVRSFVLSDVSTFMV